MEIRYLIDGFGTKTRYLIDGFGTKTRKRKDREEFEDLDLSEEVGLFLFMLVVDRGVDNPVMLKSFLFVSKCATNTLLKAILRKLDIQKHHIIHEIENEVEETEFWSYKDKQIGRSVERVVRDGFIVLENIFHYKDGVKHGTIIYRNEINTDISTYNNGVRHGERRYYDGGCDLGKKKLSILGNYCNNTKHGIFRQYRSNETVGIEKVYDFGEVTNFKYLDKFGRISQRDLMIDKIDIIFDDDGED